MSQLKGACIIGQSGGPTSVINASAYGVIRTALDSGCITKVYGAAHGIKGVLDDVLYDMGQEDAKELEYLLKRRLSELDLFRQRFAELPFELVIHGTTAGTNALEPDRGGAFQERPIHGRRGTGAGARLHDRDARRCRASRLTSPTGRTARPPQSRPAWGVRHERTPHDC